MPKTNKAKEELKVEEAAAVQETVSDPAQENQSANEAAEGTEAAKASENDGYVTYCLPYLPGVKPGDYQTVTINGKNYQVKYGEAVRMPKGVADVLRRMVKSRTMVEEKIKRFQEEKCITKLE